MKHSLALAATLLSVVVAAGVMAPLVSAQGQLGFDDADDATAALAEAQAQGEAARLRAQQLEAEAAAANEAADKTAREGAALAARIQQAEAAVAANEARIRLIERDQAALRLRLAERQQPVVRLTGALQRLARRPVVLSLLRPGSVRDTMHLRAVMDTMLPEVERRTAALRSEIAKSRALAAEAAATREALERDQADRASRRKALAALETRQRLASRDVSGVADREAERALALAEQARDLGGLVDRLGEAGKLREQLALLPGPVIRPERPELARVSDEVAPSAASAGAPGGYRLPVDGRLVAGFGSTAPGALASRGIALAPRGGAQAIAPAKGRVAFAGPYRGYGNIVIVEHAGGWTSLVTGLAQLSVRVGDQLVAGAPLGSAAPVRPVLTLEVRRNGEPVNPLELVQN